MSREMHVSLSSRVSLYIREGGKNCEKPNRGWIAGRVSDNATDNWLRIYVRNYCRFLQWNVCWQLDFFRCPHVNQGEMCCSKWVKILGSSWGISWLEPSVFVVTQVSQLSGSVTIRSIQDQKSSEKIMIFSLVRENISSWLKTNVFSFFCGYSQENVLLTWSSR